MLIKILFIQLFAFVCVYTCMSQNKCMATVNDLYRTIALRKYDLNKIDKGYEPGYERDLHVGDFVDVHNIYKDYAIVSINSDTFVVHIKFLQSSCFDNMADNYEAEKNKIEEEKKRIEIEKSKAIAIKDSIEIERTRANSIKFLSRKDNGINRVSHVRVDIDDIAALENVIESEKIIFLSSEDHPELVGYQDYYFAYVIHKGKLYKTSMDNLISPSVDSIRLDIKNKDRINNIKKKKDLEEKAKKRRADILSEFGEECGNAILRREVYIGMSAKAAKLSWGTPLDINRTITKYGTHEQWVYGGGNNLYFEDGILTTIQN